MVGAAIQIFEFADQVAAIVRRSAAHLHGSRAVLRRERPIYIDGHAIRLCLTAPATCHTRIQRFPAYGRGVSLDGKIEVQWPAIAIEGDVSAGTTWCN